MTKHEDFEKTLFDFHGKTHYFTVEDNYILYRGGCLVRSGLSIDHTQAIGEILSWATKHDHFVENYVTTDKKEIL